MKRHGGNLSACYYQLEKATYYIYNSNYVTLWKRQNYGDSKKISGCQGLRGRVGWTGGVQSETTVYEITMVNNCHYLFVQTHRMYNI